MPRAPRLDYSVTIHYFTKLRVRTSVTLKWIAMGLEHGTHVTNWSQNAKANNEENNQYELNIE
ncbi:MAG: hypothetical protein HOP33_00390 [Verrucomicrobia bacterium]|nr:hypothetical protein [Verrucomicrobiota bacterium]